MNNSKSYPIFLPLGNLYPVSIIRSHSIKRQDTSHIKKRSRHCTVHHVIE